MKIIKKVLMILVVLIVAGLIVIQFFPIDKTNPPIVQADTLEASVTVPENVRSIIDRSCADCHSYKSVYPWYSNVQPVGWFLKNHIVDARSNLNLSAFNALPGKRKIRKLEQICEQVTSKEMPLPSYLWIHRDSVMKDGDDKILCDWANTEKAKITE